MVVRRWTMTREGLCFAQPTGRIRTQPYTLTRKKVLVQDDRWRDVVHYGDVQRNERLDLIVHVVDGSLST